VVAGLGVGTTLAASAFCASVEAVASARLTWSLSSNTNHEKSLYEQSTLSLLRSSPDMNSQLTRHACKIQILSIATVLFGFLSLALGLVVSPSDAQETEKVSSVESKHKNPCIFDLLFDVSLDLISEKEFKAQLTAAGITDFKAELEKSLKELKGDRVGFRQVNTDQFSKLFRSMEIVSSAQQVEVIGVTKDRAYLEVSLFLTDKSRYVAVVAAKLVELPEAIVKKLK
jgi:hypothetical protein